MHSSQKSVIHPVTTEQCSAKIQRLIWILHDSAALLSEFENSLVSDLHTQLEIHNLKKPGGIHHLRVMTRIALPEVTGAPASELEDFKAQVATNEKSKLLKGHWDDLQAQLSGADSSQLELLPSRTVVVVAKS